MKLPNGDRAIVTDDKLLGYLLNEQHESNVGTQAFRKQIQLRYKIAIHRVLNLASASNEAHEAAMHATFTRLNAATPTQS